MEEKIISMLENLIQMQKEYQKKNEEDIQNLKTELKSEMASMKTELKSDIAELKADVEILKAEVAELKAEVETLKVEVAELKADVEILKAEVAELKTDVSTLKSQRMIDTNNLALVLNQQTKMMKMLEDIYGEGRQLDYVM